MKKSAKEIIDGLIPTIADRLTLELKIAWMKQYHIHATYLQMHWTESDHLHTEFHNARYETLSDLIYSNIIMSDTIYPSGYWIDLAKLINS
jgi:hypothetical protein